MNWALIVIVLIVVFGALAGFVYSVMRHSFGPFCDDGDDCSTDNPEREHE